MRILTFSTLYPSAPRPTHGIFVETRLRKLVASGRVDARVVAPSPWFPFDSPKFRAYAAFARMPRSELRHGLRVDHPRYPLLPKIGMSSAPLMLFAGVLPLLRRQMHRGNDFDLIDAHYFYPDGVAAVMLGMALGRPTVITARGDDIDLISTYRIPRKWIQWAAKHAAGLITVSNGLRRRLEVLGAPPERIRVLRNGVDLARFCPADHDQARKTAGFVHPTLLAVGNLVPKKRHVLIVEALVELSGVDLAIIGEGPERARIEARARQLGVSDRLRFLGRKPQEELPVLYSAAEVLVHPSSREGWPNVLLESIACGTPVVVAEFGSVGDIVRSPEAGRILDQATPSCLAQTLRSLLEAPPNRNDTRRYAEDFGWESTTNGQVDLFEKILCNANAKRGRGHIIDTQPH